MRDNEIIGTGWLPTTEVMDSAHGVIDAALKEAGLEMADIEAVGTTGYAGT